MSAERVVSDFRSGFTLPAGIQKAGFRMQGTFNETTNDNKVEVMIGCHSIGGDGYTLRNGSTAITSVVVVRYHRWADGGGAANGPPTSSLTGPPCAVLQLCDPARG